MTEAQATPAGPIAWDYELGDASAGGVWTEAVTGHGQDAEPLFVHHLPTGQGIIAVFDGSGGAGSAPAYWTSDGTPRTGAWLGARVARTALESWFGASVLNGEGFGTADLESRLARMLEAMRPATASRIVGRMQKELPTTMAALHYRLRHGAVDCRVLWAGDSRVYVLTPDHGLQALSRDHTEEEDGLVQLLQDPPLSNVICADSPFFVQVRRLSLELPCVLLCATDGFFGYVQTPAHFEYRLLAVLQDSDSMKDWCGRLGRDISGYAADDASLSMVTLGFTDFPSLRTAFAGRERGLGRRYWSNRPREHTGPPDADRNGARPEGPSAEERVGRHERKWRQLTWDSYRGDYERLMPPPDLEREHETRRHDQRLPGDHPAR
ncbi:PP2C family protein-serine/threonine phosphatase [Actinomadura formosensis]|uniref:PP2C family protein-serine/threonine phosphatase n=1 Tax=Actinomadura formosensis TaxID=60706 RepID=UPI003D911192